MSRVNRALTYLRQLPKPEAAALLVVDGIRTLLDPASRPSYGQTGEDLAIQTLLGAQQRGFYADIGCNHPKSMSNTFELYKRGWHGIVVDANAHLVELQRRLRPRDIAICAAVSDQEGTAEFTEFEDDAVSSLSKKHVEEWGRLRKVARTQVVRTTTLTRLLADNGAPAKFDLLSVDVEGHDYEVLAGLDFEKYRPRLIVAEMHGFEIGHPSSSRTYQLLTHAGYEMAGFLVMNGYFRDSR